MVFEKQDGHFVFRRYEPGWVFAQCVTLKAIAGRDRLFCLSDEASMGENDSWVAEIRLDRDASGEITLDANAGALLSAEYKIAGDRTS